MQGKRKFFNKSLYKQYDAIAKLSVMRIFKDLTKYVVEENNKKTGVDLLVFKNGKHVFNIECEIKNVWQTDKFQYDSVQFPERKEKFARLDLPTLFVMFNEDQSSYLVVRDKDLLSSPKVEVSNRYMKFGEYFFRVPIDKVTLNEIKSVIKQMEKENGI